MYCMSKAMVIGEEMVGGESFVYGCLSDDSAIH